MILKRLMIIALFFYIEARPDVSSAYLIDRIEAVIFGDEAIKVITHSDIERPSIDGQHRSREDLVLEQLIYEDAKKYNIVADEEKIEKSLLTVQKQNNLTQDQLNAIFKAAGYTPEEGREQFGRMTIVNSVMDFKVRANCGVSEQEVNDYYEKNPQWQEASYYLQRGVAARDPHESLAQAKISLPKKMSRVIGAIPFWIRENEIAIEKDFVKKMKIGDIEVSVLHEKEWEIFKLIDKKEKSLVSLEIRREEIMNILGKEKYKKRLKDYTDSLWKEGVVRIFS